jgi:hypothetical protein
MAQIQGEPFLFSSSLDGTIKAWRFLDMANGGAPAATLTMVLEKQIGEAVNSL